MFFTVDLFRLVRLQRPAQPGHGIRSAVRPVERSADTWRADVVHTDKLVGLVYAVRHGGVQYGNMVPPDGRTEGAERSNNEYWS